MARKKKRLSRRDKRDLKIIEARKNQPTRPYEEVAKELEEQDYEEVRQKMLSIIKKRGPMTIDELWRATLIGFGLKMKDLYTDKWIPEEMLQDCMGALLVWGELKLLPDRRLKFGK
jgi:hypothetical protein